MSNPTPPTYRTRNWPSYSEALTRRSSLTIWFDPAITLGSRANGKRGRQPTYGNASIQTFLIIKVLIGLDWPVP
jgi:hypothetical protein